MRKILLLSAAVMAVLAGPALAQDRGQRGGDHGGGGERGGGRPPAAAPAASAPAARAPQASAPQAARPSRGDVAHQSIQRQQTQQAQADALRAHRNDNRPDANRGNDNRGNNRGNFGRNDNNRPDFNRGGNDNRGNFGRDDHRPGNNGFRGRPNPGYSQYHRAFNAPHRYRYRGGAYHRPPGFSYRRWNFGDFLPSLYWGSSYWINDFSYYDLMPPPPGAVWVRYGDDAVLIDRYTGEVIQVEYSVFY